MSNRELIKKMKERGWSYTLTGKSHLRFVYEKTGDFLFHSGTSSDHRGLKNFFARAKRVETASQ